MGRFEVGESSEAVMAGDLWKVVQEGYSSYIVDPNGDYRILVLGCSLTEQADALFARQLCHILNSTPIRKFQTTHADMDLRGVPK